MTVPLDMRNDIRNMDALGVPRAELAGDLGLSRNTVAKYADMEDMSPAPPVAAGRPHPSVDAHAGWIRDVLEVDLGAPRKQRHIAKRIYDRLVAERGCTGSYSSARRFVTGWRASLPASGGDGFLELDWAPGTARADFGSFRAEIAGRPLDLRLPVITLPHSNARFCAAAMCQRAECLCDGLAGIFGQMGRARRGGGQGLLAHGHGAQGVGGGGDPEAGGVPRVLPRGRAREQGDIGEGRPAQALRAAVPEALRGLRLLVIPLL